MTEYPNTGGAYIRLEDGTLVREDEGRTPQPAPEPPPETEPPAADEDED